MLIVHAKKLENTGIPCRSRNQIDFQGHSFERGVTFSKHLLFQTLAVLTQEGFSAHDSYLIIEDETHFTLWRQTNDLEQPLEAQSDKLSFHNTQEFCQRFACTKRTTLSRVASSPEKLSFQPIKRDYSG